MAGDAYDTIQRFWEIQNDRDYRRTVELFAEDAVFVDPVFGTFEGREAIGAFMEKMTAQMNHINAAFTLEELEGDDRTAWAQWVSPPITGPATALACIESGMGRSPTRRTT